MHELRQLQKERKAQAKKSIAAKQTKPSAPMPHPNGAMSEDAFRAPETTDSR
jgi:hypothetical protein